ncbi:MAG: NAD-dependent epimerase/dehydratase family protein [Alphaproteobacteria bacterium]|nr:NAD-dependent epimerase/dehydratase family protein [Alphaproteobacteria bacterium]
MASKFDGSTLLITGGTGSFGRAAVTHFLKTSKCREIRILSRDETKQHEMRHAINSKIVRFYIGDIRDISTVEEAAKGVDYIFHAAALKQVPSCEFFPLEAVKTNVLGSSNVIQAAIKYGVRKVVCLSTDKAVQPVNAMGMTKALMEKVVMSTARQLGDSDTVVSCVRFGNVLFSRGSVIPLFIQQIREGRPITLTFREMTRFLLPISQAIELVEFALEHSTQGVVFVRKSPACSIGDLAHVLRDMFRSNVPIETIGVRHGEKIYETLLTGPELALADDFGSYYRLRNDTRDLNYDLYFSIGAAASSLGEDYTSHSTEQLNREKIRVLLESLPEMAQELVNAGLR